LNKKLLLVLLLLFSVLSASFCGGSKECAKTLNVYSLMSKEFTSKVFATFEEDSGIHVNIEYIQERNAPMILLDEYSNPKFDFVFGGSSDFYEKEAKSDVFKGYKIKSFSRLSYFNRSKEETKKWMGILINPLVFIVNNNFIQDKSLEYPNSWMDLIYPIYNHQIVIPNPISTRCGADLLCTLNQVYGGNGLIKYEEKINENACLYCDSVFQALTSVEKGYSALTICPLSYTYRLSPDEDTIKIIFPVEGTWYDKGGCAILTGVKNIECANQLIKWLKEDGMSEALDDRCYKYLSPKDMKKNVIYYNGERIKLIHIDKNWINLNRQNLMDEFESNIISSK
jgi:iron(III) transport system substrate-binding protein